MSKKYTLNENSRGECRYLYNSIQKHGFDAFKVKIIDQTDDEVERQIERTGDSR